MKNFLYAIIILLALAIPRPASPQTNAEQVMNIGRNLLAMDDYMLSIQYFNQAIKAKPYLSDPYYFRGLAKLQLDDYLGAEQDCSLAIDRNKFKSEAYKLRGFARQFLGKNKEAVADYDIGLQYNPNDKYFLYYKAVALTDLKSYHDADSTFSRLLRLYPRFEDAYTARARSNILRGDTTAAVTDLDKALALGSTQINARLMRAEINANRRNWKDALIDLDEAIRLEPREPSLFLNRAYIRYNTDDYFGAMSDYNYTIELNPANTAAIFNRALLRYEVRDLDKAYQDFTRVLNLDSDNFHARYNRALIALERHRYRDAEKDFQIIARRYPRFYQAYYAIAQCRQALGDNMGAAKALYAADDIVRKYVANPRRNPLDRPTIQPGVANNQQPPAQSGDEESETEVMERFNRLVTVNQNEKSHLAYNEQYRGKVQDLSMRVEPSAPFGFTTVPRTDGIAATSPYSRELDNLNALAIIPKIYLSDRPEAPADSIQIADLFADIDTLSALISNGSRRASDFFGRGVVYSMLKNFSAADADFSKAISLDPRFASAYIARAYASMQTAALPKSSGNLQLPAVDPLTAAMADLDKALGLDHDNDIAWFDKGYICLLRDDFTSAIQCFNEAITARPDFGEAYFNRGFAYLRMGNKQQAVDDLRKAGELGILPSYNVLKKMN